MWPFNTCIGLNSFVIAVSCCWSAMRSRQRSLLSLPTWRGDPPPFPALGGWHYPALLPAFMYCGDTARRTGRKRLQGASPPPIHGGFHYADVFPSLPSSLIRRWHGSRTWGDVIRVLLCPDYANSSEGDISYILWVWLQWYVCQVSDSFRVRTGSYGQLSWLRLPDMPFFASIISMWMSLSASAECQMDPFYAKFIAPADCSSWDIQPSLRLGLVLGQRNAAMVPGDVSYANVDFFSALCSCWHIFS